MSHRRPALQIIREGNQGHHGSDRLEGGLKLPAEAPPEPDWRLWWPTKTGSDDQDDDNARSRKVARAEWRRIVPLLDRPGLLSILDTDLLQDTCIAAAQLDHANRRIALDGGVVLGSKGQPMKHPLYTVANQLRTHLHKCWRELGMSPMARDRLPAGGYLDDADDLFD